MNPLNVIHCLIEKLGFIIKEGCHHGRVKGLSSAAAAALAGRVKGDVVGLWHVRRFVFRTRAGTGLGHTIRLTTPVFL